MGKIPDDEGPGSSLQPCGQTFYSPFKSEKSYGYGRATPLATPLRTY